MKSNAMRSSWTGYSVMLVMVLSAPSAYAGSQERELYAAAEAGDIATMERLLESGANADAVLWRKSSPRRPITVAILRGDLDATNLLIQAGVNLGKRVALEQTPLTAAAGTGDLAIMDMLLKAGVDPNRGSMGDGTPLIAAARGGHAAAVAMLLEAGADPDADSTGDGNPLIAAVYGGHLEIVRLLLAHGADVNSYVRGDDTALITAVRRGHVEIAKLLVAQGADVNQQGDRHGLKRRTPLNVADNDAQELRELLLLAGADG